MFNVLLRTKRAIVTALIVALCFALVMASGLLNVNAASTVQAALDGARAVVPSKLPVAELQENKDWYAFELARDGQNVPASYYNDMAELIEDSKGNISESEYYYVNYTRVILAFTAAGYDASNIKGYNLVEKLNEVENVEYGGVSGVARAVQAIDCNDYYKAYVSRESELVQYLLSQQSQASGTEGAWGYEYQGFNPDIDTTAIVLQALSKHTAESGVDAAINAGINYLKSQVQSDGSYYSWGSEAGGETYSQVLMALTANGVDYESDDWTKGSGLNLTDRICKYSLADGGFYASYIGEVYNDISTAQCYMGLIAASKYPTADASIFDMDNIELKEFEYITEETHVAGANTGDSNEFVLWTTAMLAAIGGIYVIATRKQHQ